MFIGVHIYENRRERHKEHTFRQEQIHYHIILYFFEVNKLYRVMYEKVYYIPTGNPAADFTVGTKTVNICTYILYNIPFCRSKAPV